MKMWMWLRESARISKDEKAAEVLIEVMSMHMHAHVCVDHARVCLRQSSQIKCNVASARIPTRNPAVYSV